MSLDDHSHCDSCIRIKCSEGCPMMSCEHDCGAIYHWCKTEEHTMFCPKYRVPCINQNYGCPKEMSREELGVHLATCPASAVSCSCEWKRCLVDKEKGTKFVQPGVTASIRESSADSAGIPSKSTFNSLPVVPDQNTPNDNNPTSQPNDNSVTDQLQTGMMNVYVSRDPCSKNDQESKETQEPNEPHCSNTICDEKPPAVIPAPVHQTSLSLNQVLSLDIETSVKPDQQKWLRTLLCSQIFRRDEYPWHVRNMHSEIYMGMDGWLQHRCPMSQYGCTYSVTRFSPNTTGARVVYNPVLNHFGVQPHSPRYPDRVVDGERDEAQKVPSLTDLPLELLEKIAMRLDGFSLNNMTRTCVLLNSVCCAVLKKKGVVSLEWQREESADKISWSAENTTWRFPNSVTPIRVWKIDDLFSMSTHLKTCPFNEKFVRTERFKVMLPHDLKIVKE